MELSEIFACGGFIVHKYIWLICHALAEKDELLRNYISIILGARLANVIAGFHNVIGLLKFMCGVIVGTHCKLYRKPPQPLIRGDYWGRYDICNILI